MGADHAFDKLLESEARPVGMAAGAARAQDAGGALERFESVSRDLSSMIEGISQEAQAQSEVAKHIASQMNSIRERSIQTSGGSEKTVLSVGRPANLVHAVRESFADSGPPPVGETGRDA